MEKSLWMAESTETNYPRLNTNEKTDICIIGGGIAGAVTAYLLTKQGKKVIVVERNKIGAGVTANSTAKLTSQHGLFYKYLADNYGINVAKKYLESNEEGIKLAEKIINDENIECDYEKKDAYVFATSESELDKIKQEINVIKQIGFNAEFVKDIDIPVEKCLGAMKFNNQAQFDSRKYTIELMNRVEKMGGKIYFTSSFPRHVIKNYFETKKIFKVVDIVTINGVEKKKYTCDYCIPCEFKSECTSQHRRIFYEHYDADIEEIRRYYYSDEGQEIYFQRGHFAETGFAILTEARNFRGIKTKGLQKANDELTISEIYHNLIKLHKHTTNKFLKLILNIVKKSDETEKIDFSCIKKFQGKFIVQKDVITGIREHKHSKN